MGRKPWASAHRLISRNALASGLARLMIDAKNSIRHGGNFKQHDLDHVEVLANEISGSCLAVHDAHSKFEERDKVKAELVKLRYFAGFCIPEAAEALGISSATADRYWAYALAWLHNEIRQDISD